MLQEDLREKKEAKDLLGLHGGNYKRAISDAEEMSGDGFDLEVNWIEVADILRHEHDAQ